ncbi:fibrous sheath-interacting protein 2 isoform X2 [Amia ocellicauda]|uniref:fibrous sheath-interacting protein 2 isoform X2 n=1 Tax=Amia ocellicauda TaxID=2972642 RepID=UPI003463D9DD
MSPMHFNNEVPLPKDQGWHGDLDSLRGVKLFVPKGVHHAYYTTSLCQRRHEQRPDFDLLDPHCHLLDNEYNSQQDPHLKGFYKNKAMEKKVACSLKDFNRYNDYLKTVKMDWEKSYRQKQKELVKQFLILQEQKIIPEDMAVTDMKEWLLEKDSSSFWQQDKACRHRTGADRPGRSSAERACNMNELQMLQELEVEVRRELRVERRCKKTSVKPDMLEKLREAARRIARNRKVSPAAEEDMQSA